MTLNRFNTILSPRGDVLSSLGITEKEIKFLDGERPPQNFVIVFWRPTLPKNEAGPGFQGH